MGRSKDVKRSKSNADPILSKNPKLVNTPSSYHYLRPSWRVSRIELVDPFGWHVLNFQQISYLKEKLSHFEKMSWNEILIDSKKQNHSIEVSCLCKPAKDRLVATKQDDIDELVSLHLSGRQRVWGVLEQGTLNLLWWDPDHQIYPYEKKHT